MKLSDFFELTLLASIWGASFLFMRIASPELGPILLMTLRVGIAAICLLPVLFYYKQGPELGKHWRHLFIVGLVSTALPFTLFGYATLSLPAGITSVLNTTTPMFGVIIALFWFKEKITLPVITGLGIGVMGIYLLMFDKLHLETDNSIMLPTAATFVATFCYALSANYTKKYLSGVKPLVQATGSLVAATLILLPFSIFNLPENDISTKVIISTGLLGVICTAVAYILFFRLLANVGPNKAISVTYLIPIFGVFWGSILLDENITLTMITGIVIVLLGVALSTGFIKRPNKRTQ